MYNSLYIKERINFFTLGVLCNELKEGKIWFQGPQEEGSLGSVTIENL